MAAKKDALDEFLDVVPRSKCKTCRHPRKSEVEEACQRYLKRRADNTTSVTWIFFMRHLATLGYTITHISLRTHLEKCLGWPKT